MGKLIERLGTMSNYYLYILIFCCLLPILIYIFQTKKYKLALISPKSCLCYYSSNEKKSKKLIMSFSNIQMFEITL